MTGKEGGAVDFSGDYPVERTRIERGGAEKYHQAAAAAGKYHARERIRRLCDPDSFREDALWANPDPTLPADGVVVGTATVQGRPIRLVANDSTVKAGSWGARTVEKIIRTVEAAQLEQHPIVYLVDSAGARITDQVQLFPGRRGAGRIFHEQVRASGRIPQACALFGPSAAGGAYIPAFCDIVAMVDGNASMYLGSPRMVEMVTGEKTTLEEMGGARVHCEQSGVGHFLCRNEDEAIADVRRWLSYLPSNWTRPALEPPLGPGEETLRPDAMRDGQRRSTLYDRDVAAREHRWRLCRDRTPLHADPPGRDDDAHPLLIGIGPHREARSEYACRHPSDAHDERMRRIGGYCEYRFAGQLDGTYAVRIGRVANATLRRQHDAPAIGQCEGRPLRTRSHEFPHVGRRSVGARRTMCHAR